MAVLRLSGPGSGPALARLSRRPLPPPRRAVLRRLLDPEGAAPLDEALVLWLPGPASFTGEDMVELHLHGGCAVVEAVGAALAALPGLRPAEPGEFARRAFLNGRLDLTRAEAIADLVAAETEAQRRQALRQMGGALARLYDGWRERLVRALAHLEATIDFAEEDLPQTLPDVARHDILVLHDEITQHLDDRGVGERLREGLVVVLVGAPNVGKSSLLNRLARREAAIVSATAGTTRDVIEVHLDLFGYPVTLLDTAGLRAAGDEIEAEGVRRALARAAEADLKVALFDATADPVLDPATVALVDARTIPVLNKIDAVTDCPNLNLGGSPLLPLSARTGAGLDGLAEALHAAVEKRLERHASTPPLTRARHRRALEDCREALARALHASQPELLAEDLRLAARALGRITGRVDVEDLLDVIFRDFCIGK
ncbi:MAG: tRNA uridine-5-carboxymethylaminomethyl(34) synthesis GTPase MnmE [Rhodospirillaceae bacterium]|nr:tRNA uridine-5-carboxymethylaminomethyl(34) synthesis GTPase MnmE [Rhodospirillaceae bacterium]